MEARGGWIESRERPVFRWVSVSAKSLLGT